MLGIKIRNLPGPGLMIKTIAGLLIYFFMLKTVFSDDETISASESAYVSYDESTSHLLHVMIFSLLISVIIWLLNRYGVFKALSIFSSIDMDQRSISPRWSDHSIKRMMSDFDNSASPLVNDTSRDC